MIRPKNEIEDLLLSITTNCETFKNGAHTKPQGTLEIKFTKPREFFHINHLLVLVLTLIGWLD